MAACAVIGEPVAQIFVRDTLANHSGLGAVGLLQGVWRLSDLYVTVFIGIFSMYYLPRFVEVRTASELYREILRALGYIIPAVAVGSFAIYLLRDFLISLAYSREFMPMRDLFGWQMVGNVLKMTGWLFGYVLVARVSPLKICLLELAKGAAWVGFALWFVPRLGAIGAVLSFVATYAVYVFIAAISVFVVGQRMKRAEVRESAA
jgi:antigen flippase